jgi:hypothetical protein
MRVVALTTTHSQAELEEADTRAARLTDIEIVPRDMRTGRRFTVRVTGV